MGIDQVFLQEALYNRSVGGIKGTEKSKSSKMGSQGEAKEAAVEFASLLYEQMTGAMLSTVPGEKSMGEEIWWDFLFREIAREIARSPQSPLAEQLYQQIKDLPGTEK